MASSDEQLRPIPELRMEALRDVASALDDETLMVVVLAGSQERGLALSVSSQLSEEQTWGLLAHAVASEADEQGWSEG